LESRRKEQEGAKEERRRRRDIFSSSSLSCRYLLSLSPSSREKMCFSRYKQGEGTFDSDDDAFNRSLVSS
jgi:hypothetical protein